MCAIAFVPVENVIADFEKFIDTVPYTFMPIATYFEQTYTLRV